MGEENLTGFRLAFNGRDPVGGILEAALTTPDSLGRDSVEVVAAALQIDAGGHARCRLALSALAAILFARPDLVDGTLVDRLADLASVESLPHDIGGQLVQLFEFFAASPAAPRAWTRLSGVLRDAGLTEKARARLLPLVSEFVGWRQDLVGLDGILALAEAMPSTEQRAFLLDHGVEPFVFCAPETFTVARLERMAPFFAHAPRYHYTLRFLAARRTLASGVRAFLARQLAGRFPFQTAAAAILVDRPVRMLVVMNIKLGQGDEIVRLAPLLQALLDANPLLTITLVAQRTYLYDNPRVTIVRVGDEATTQAALGESYDAAIEIFQPDRPDFAYRFELHATLERLLVESPPAFVVRAELGRAEKGHLGIRSEFLFQTVQLGERDVARSRGLDRVALRSNYEPCLRLLAELGLPQRVAEETPLTESLLAGVRSADAERVWGGLVAPKATRAVALVNPFGGAGHTKGFYEQDAILAAEVGGLIDEGYLVVLLPNGTSWGRRTAILSALSHLDPQTRACVRVGPDPAETNPAVRLDLAERPELDYADRVMRLFKYFATYADLVVTVEGWLAHLAYSLGRPFRLFVAAGSFTPDWFPYGRGRTQQLVAAFSPRSRPSTAGVGLRRGSDQAWMPHRPRKALLRLALAGLAAPADGETVTALRGATASHDSDVRAWAIAALGRIAPVDAKADLLAALQARAPAVVREAADALLRAHVDCSCELGPRYRDLLKAHGDIVRQEWDAVAQVGPAVFPALFRAGESQSYVLAQEAKALLRRMLAPYVTLPPASGPPHPSKDRPAPRPALAGALRALLTSPACLDPSGLDDLAVALRLDPDDPDSCELALATLAALLYARPDLVDPALVERVADLLSAVPLPDKILGAVVKLFEFLASTRYALRAWTRLSDVLRDERLDDGARQRLVALVNEFVHWRSDLVGLDGALAVAQSAALASHRAFLLDHGVEPFVFCAPEAFTVERLQQVAGAFGDTPRYPYVLYSLANRRTLAPEVHDFLTGALAGRFPHQETAAAILKNGPVRLVVVMNIGMGQGDDVVRLVPLLQGLLDANPALSITLATWRPYLYDNPRVTTVAIADDAAIEAALDAGLDGVVEFFQPESPGFTFRIEAHQAVERHLAEHRPAFLVKGDIGRACRGQVGDRFSFLHQTVELEGCDIARSRGLDQSPLRNVYEPAMRLLAELGLPQRAAEEAPLSPSVLTGTRSADAERIWADLVAQQSKAGERPVALLNPFGGSGVTKGFYGQDALVAAEICGLVDEGYLVVVLPNGQAWGRRDAIRGILSHLDPDRRALVRVAPDPAENDTAIQLVLRERSTLAYRDRVMRAFKYFTTYADLVVTAEGWLAHLAYNLGRPFRLFLAAGSYSSEYHPRNRGRGQQLVTVLSPRSCAPYSESALLREGDPPPLPHRPRKSLLELALPGLGGCGGAEVVAPLHRALASPDADVRTWAAVALGRVVPAEAGKGDLLAALEDRSPAVVREAADALLRERVDCSRELGARYRDVLQANADIARQNWDAVARAGPAALPALFKAAESEVHDVREGARTLLRTMLLPFLREVRPSEGSVTTS
jgi:HEAT repeat protein